jgi:sugar O-acyltransferase (sialic acid O-acetyltransferase NeuD family)
MNVNHRRIILIGAGGHAKVVFDAIDDENGDVVAVIDPKAKSNEWPVPVFSDYDQKIEEGAACLIGIGNNKTRKELNDRIRHSFAFVVHHTAVVSSKVIVGEGSMILHGAIIQTGSVIGKHVIVNTGAQIDHDGKIGDYVHIAPGAVLCGNVTVGEGSLIGAGAVVIPGKNIGQWATIGAGAVVTTDVPDYATVVGVPAKIVKTR